MQSLFLADMDGKKPLPSLFKEPFGIILGNEGHGAYLEIKTFFSYDFIPRLNHYYLTS